MPCHAMRVCDAHTEQSKEKKAKGVCAERGARDKKNGRRGEDKHNINIARKPR